MKLFINNIESLVNILKQQHRINNHIQDFTEILLLLSLSCKFWTKARIELKEQYLNEIDQCECNMNKFYKHGLDALFADSV